MNIEQFYPSKYLKGTDIEGRNVTVTISKVTEETMGFGENEETLPVVWFEGKQKGLVLKKTNAMSIAKLYGKETNEWSGKRITLTTRKMRAFGDMQTVIVVLPPPHEPEQSE